MELKLLFLSTSRALLIPVSGQEGLGKFIKKAIKPKTHMGAAHYRHKTDLTEISI
jgi:hypothetical protein